MLILSTKTMTKKMCFEEIYYMMDLMVNSIFIFDDKNVLHNLIVAVQGNSHFETNVNLDIILDLNYPDKPM